MKNVLVFFDDENNLAEIDLRKNSNVDAQFNFYGYRIKAREQIQNLDLDENEICMVIVGESTRFLASSFIADLRKVINSALPILCLNINECIGLDEANCPRILWDCGAIHMPFSKESLIYLLQEVSYQDRNQNSKGSFHLRQHPRPFDLE